MPYTQSQISVALHLYTLAVNETGQGVPAAAGIVRRLSLEEGGDKLWR